MALTQSVSGIGVGLLGLGVVGSGVARALLDRAAQITSQAGVELNLRRVLVRDPERPRSFSVPRELLSTEAADLLADPTIGLVVEAWGDAGQAYLFIKEALAQGKDVVTANKEVIAKHALELRAWAHGHGRAIKYEASVGGGMPIVSTLTEDLAANRILGLRAIINGTTNYILSRMSTERLPFKEALRQAQELGYAEPDPNNDIQGIDAAYKLAILSSIAFKTHVSPEDIFREGISSLGPQDFRYAQGMGYTIKLLAIAKLVAAGDGSQESVQVRVHPTLVPQESLLAQVHGVYNAVQVEGDLVGPLVLYGRGAGAEPTSSAILADVIRIAKARAQGSVIEAEPAPNGYRHLLPFDDLETRYYLRMAVADRPGVLAQIARIFGEHHISIASFIQQETDEDAQVAEIVIMTHIAKERSVQLALRDIRELYVVREVGAVVRVET